MTTNDTATRDEAVTDEMAKDAIEVLDTYRYGREAADWHYFTMLEHYQASSVENLRAARDTAREEYARLRELYERVMWRSNAAGILAAIGTVVLIAVLLGWRP